MIEYATTSDEFDPEQIDGAPHPEPPDESWTLFAVNYVRGHREECNEYRTYTKVVMYVYYTWTKQV